MFLKPVENNRITYQPQLVSEHRISQPNHQQYIIWVHQDDVTPFFLGWKSTKNLNL